MPAPKRARLDRVLVDRGLVESRERAQALILAGQVVVGERRVDKPAFPVAADAPIRLRGEPPPFVSRGGLKLAHALDTFGIDPRGAVVLDVGASTGGFSDCLLQRGARHVYALDVGYGQLAWSLRQDPRVTVIERTNIRDYDGSQLLLPVDLVVVDVSFISLRLVLPAVRRLLPQAHDLVVLVKPQFEVGRGGVGRGGVVRDEGLRQQAVADIVACAQQLGLRADGVTPSPILGPAGNVEFLVWLRSETSATAKPEPADAPPAAGSEHAAVPLRERGP